MSESDFNVHAFRLKFADACIEVSERVANPSESGYDRFVGLEHMETGEPKLRKFGSTADLASAMKLFKTGDVLVARRNVYLKRASVADFDGVCSGDAIVLRPKIDGRIAPEIIPYVLNTEHFWEYAIKHAAGTMSKRLSVENLLQYEFSLPPMDEQQKIVQVLSASQECAEAYYEAEVALKKCLLSRTDELFNGSDDGCVETKTIGAIAEVQYGLTINAKRQILGKQLPYLRVANVQRFHIDMSEVKEIGVTSKDDGCILQSNDILVVEGHADINELGRASIWEDQLPVCLHQNHLIRIRCFPEVDPYYVLEYINSPAGRAYFRGRGKSTSGLNTLNSTVVREMPIPIPPLASQNAISDELKEARRSLKEITDRKEQHATVSKRLSAEIFGGRQG